MVASGQGKQPKPWAPPQPVARVREPATCSVHAALKPTPQGRVHLTLSKQITEGTVHTSQEDIATSVSAFWEGLLNAVHTPSEQAEREKAGVLKSVTEGLKTDNLIRLDNIIDAIRSLSRGSTPGEDDMRLEFFLKNVHEIAPLLSKLYTDVLAKGHMTPSMCHAINSPIYKNKGSREDRAMYRPISVTTTPYRILAKCIAQKLSLAVPTLIGDPHR